MKGVADGAAVVAAGVLLEEAEDEWLVGATLLEDGLADVDVDQTPHELLLETGAGAVPVGMTTVLFDDQTDQT